MIQREFDCSQARRSLALHAGRDLEDDSSAAVERHLEGCAACRGELAAVHAARERIAVLGARTAREAEDLDLWPGLRAGLARERERAPTAEALPPAASAPRRSFARRAWLPASLAAAAALVIAIRTLGLPPATPGSQLSPPPGPLVQGPLVQSTPSAESGEVAATRREPDSPGFPGSPADPALDAGTLRRALPGDERLRDSSAPFGRRGAPWGAGGAAPTPNTLASDAELR